MTTTADNNAVIADVLLEETYNSVSSLIWKVVHKYHKKYGGEIDELKAVANRWFMEAVHTWDESKGAFTTHVWTKVYNGLRNEAVALYKQGGFATKPAHLSKEEYIQLKEDGDGTVSFNLERLASRKHFDLKEFLANLSQEAQELVHVVITLNSEQQPITQHTLAEFFHEVGWAASEFLRAFREVSEALM